MRGGAVLPWMSIEGGFPHAVVNACRPNNPKSLESSACALAVDRSTANAMASATRPRVRPIHVMHDVAQQAACHHVRDVKSRVVCTTRRPVAPPRCRAEKARPGQQRSDGPTVPLRGGDATG